MTWHGVHGMGMARAWHGMAWHDVAWHGMAWHGQHGACLGTVLLVRLMAPGCDSRGLHFQPALCTPCSVSPCSALPSSRHTPMSSGRSLQQQVCMRMHEQTGWRALAMSWRLGLCTPSIHGPAHVQCASCLVWPLLQARPRTGRCPPWWCAPPPWWRTGPLRSQSLWPLRCCARWPTTARPLSAPRCAASWHSTTCWS